MNRAALKMTFTESADDLIAPSTAVVLSVPIIPVSIIDYINNRYGDPAISAFVLGVAVLLLARIFTPVLFFIIMSFVTIAAVAFGGVYAISHRSIRSKATRRLRLWIWWLCVKDLKRNNRVSNRWAHAVVRSSYMIPDEIHGGEMDKLCKEIAFSGKYAKTLRRQVAISQAVRDLSIVFFFFGMVYSTVPREILGVALPWRLFGIILVIGSVFMFSWDLLARLNDQDYISMACVLEVLDHNPVAREVPLAPVIQKTDSLRRLRQGIPFR